MELATFECKLAQLQLTRFQEGHPLSPEAIAALEEHLSECPHCQQQVAPKAAATAAVEVAPEPEPTPMAEKATPNKATLALVPLIQKGLGAVPGRTRTVFLTGLLAATLFAMSAISNDPTKLLGPRASALPGSVPKVVASDVVERPESDAHLAIQLEEKKFTTPAKTETAKAETPKAQAPKPQIAKPETPKVTKPRPAKAVTRRAAPAAKRARPAPRRAVAKPAPRPAQSGIVIYDSEGKRIR